MARECQNMTELVDSWTIKQLYDAAEHLADVRFFLEKLEQVQPENAISAQLGALFVEAYDGSSEIWSHMDQCQWTCTIRMMISKVLKIIKLENIAERLKPAKPSTSTSPMILEVLKITKPENIAKRIKASKPSSSPGLITMEMVGFIEVLLDTAHDKLLSFSLVHASRLYVLKRKLRYLQVFFTLTTRWCIEHENMKDLFTHVEDVAYTATHMCFLGVGKAMDREFSELLEKISPFKPELRQIYKSLLTVSKSSLLDTTMNVRISPFSFVSALQEDLKELVIRDTSLKVFLDNQIPWLQQGLLYLSRYLRDIEIEFTPLEEFNSLQSNIVALAIEAAIAIYSSYDEEMDETTEMKRVFFHLQLKFSHVKLEACLIKLLNSESTIVAPLKDLIHYIREELIFLGTFLMDSLEKCKEQIKITDFLTLIQSVTSQAWSVTLSHDSEQEDLSRQTNRLHVQLLLKFKFIKAAIRQMCPDISALSTLDHPTIDLLNFLPINFEVIDSYFNMLKSSKAPSSDSPKMDEILMGFHEYIISKLLLKDETNFTFTAANEDKFFYNGLLLLATYLVDPLVHHSGGHKKEDNLLTGFGTVAIESESAICLSYEDVVDSNKIRKVNLVLQFLTIAFKLIESQRILMDLLKHKATLEAQILDLIESAHEDLIFLRAFLMDLLMRHTELNEVHDLLRHAEGTANKLVQVCGFCYEGFMDGGSTEKMLLSLSDLPQEIESVKVEVRKVWFQLLDASPWNVTDGEDIIFLLNHQDRVLNSDDYSISYLKNQVPVVKEKLVYLGSFLADIIQHRDMHQELQDLMKRVQDIMFVCFFHVKGYTPAWHDMLHLSDVKQLLRFVEAEVKMFCFKVPDSSCYSFPKTNGLGFLDCFLGKLGELSSSKLDLIIDLKHQIQLLQDGLLCLRSLTDQFAESYDEHDEVYGRITSSTEIAYKAEYVIDSCLACSYPLWYKVLWISEVVKNINLVNAVVSETCERKNNDVAVTAAAKTSGNLLPSLSANTPRTNEEMEGFQDAMNELKKQLLEGSPELDVISIFGMPGLGKTTLAKKIYSDPIVTSYFDVRAQCCVTQVYSWRELLLTILNDVLEPTDRNLKEDGELADELRRFLLTKRFLILVDDVWDTKVWDYLHMCCRGSRNGSRIILTTRLSDVASYAQCYSKPHHLRLFRDDESWTLLQKEVFQGEICPPELLDVGFRIAKTCGGLPLFIVLVAGVLKEKKKKAELWKEIEESLGSQNIGCLEESMSMIGFSYKNLPHQLKPCFLYFGGFLKGKNIHVSKLTRLWLAEGFVQANKGPEDAAQGFLEDLISRNLVMDVEKKPNGKVKTCRIHDLLHKFCLEKAKQENFLLRINGFCVGDTFPEKPMEYILFIHSSEDHIDQWQPSRSNVRSLVLNVIDPDNLLWPHNISFIFDSFKLVKVLDLESFNIGGTFPSEIQSLIHLRYFAARTGASSIPSSIAKLWNLETFVVRGLGGEVKLPSSLLKLVKLRHIHVKNCASFSLHDNMGESLADCQLDNLETFSTPHLSYGEDTEMILRKVPKLRKLSCIFSETFGYSKIVMGRCVLFPRLESLSHLESLKLVSNSYPAKLPHVFSFPSRLRELTLSKFRLPWSQISTIGELPNLEILKLHLRAFEGNHWEVKDSEFPELTYLELDDINIAQWSVSDNAFPKLKCLVLTKCKRLEKIPSHFDDSVSLRSIEVNWCNLSVAESAQEIQTTQHEEMANGAFTVRIQPPDWATRSSPLTLI
ncbi:putative late blight resistance protein homolog R1B-16 isoform X1 [Nicotiana tabacum]|uniref:Late blight resistance protein homolog R1B-16 isoform X1 n=2 Tax=Nicotiana tabacum TaxID=4097 RepID=A0AC58TI02_TOBAC